MISFKDWSDLLGAFASLNTEVKVMAQAINDRLDQLTSAINAEKEEVAASLQALRDEIAQGKLDEAEITRRLDETIEGVKNINVNQQPAETGGDVEPQPIP